MKIRSLQKKFEKAIKRSVADALRSSVNDICYNAVQDIQVTPLRPIVVLDTSRRASVYISMSESDSLTWKINWREFVRESIEWADTDEDFEILRKAAAHLVREVNKETKRRMGE